MGKQDHLNTYADNVHVHRTAPEPPDIKNTHLGLGLGAGRWGWGLGLGLGLGHELRNRAPCNNGSRQANRLASNYFLI